MKPEVLLKPEFVEFIPDELQERTLYIAPKYRTVVHKCCCGCGRNVVTPLSPAAWKLTFDGVSISLHPSVGNWSLPCKSHYWIDQNRVRWSSQWTAAQIEAGRTAEARARAEYYDEGFPEIALQPAQQSPDADKPVHPSPSEGFWRRLWRRVFG